MGRKLSEAEKARRAARRLEKKRREELGPLFADQAEPVDERRLMIERRLGYARMAEHQHGRHDALHVLDRMYARQLELLARRHLPTRVVDREASRLRDLGPDIQVSSWLGLLRGESRVLSYSEAAGPTRSGLRLMLGEPWPPAGWTPPFTKAETDHLFWSRCQACGWHAPGQTACGQPLRKEDDEVMAALKAALDQGAKSWTR